MKQYTLTPEQEQIIIDALRDRIGKIFDYAEAYKKSGNKYGQLDCIDEKNRVKDVLDLFTKK